MDGMMWMSLILPFLYSLLIGSAWSAATGKKFSDSLAPAFMMHILLLMFSGMIFRNLSVGFYGGIAAAALTNLFFLWKNRAGINKQSAIDYARDALRNGVLLFVFFYFFCFVTNSGKYFGSWDEFSHWGLFLKESLRLDQLYCVSPIIHAHRDYVPAVTLFEVIWCRLAGGFHEADAYRAIQIFMYAMMMPMFDRVRERKARVAAVFAVLLVPMIFTTYDGFRFYHSVYCDYVVGVLVFYCAFEAWKARKATAYHVFVLTLSLTVMVCAKMTAMACLPMILLLYVMKRLADPERRSYGRKRFVSYLPLVTVPVGIWLSFNRFVDIYVPNTGNKQSYDGMRLSSVLEVFGSTENSSIPYLETVRRTFLRDLFSRNVLLNGSYAVVLGFIVALFLIMMRRQTEKQSRTEVCLAGVWTLFCGIGYALMMYFLYATAFTEAEAVSLASFERYMNSFLVTVIYLLIAIYYESETWKRHRKGFYVIVLAIAADLFFLHVDTFSQMLPGKFMHEEETTAAFREPARLVTEHTEEDARIFYVIRGDNYWHLIHYIFYCSPRDFGGGNIGPAMNEKDSTYQHLTIDEFREEVGQCDYFFCGELDWTFMETYRDAFESPEDLQDGPYALRQHALFRIIETTPRIRLEPVVG